MDKRFTSNNKSENLKYKGTVPDESPSYITSPRCYYHILQARTFLRGNYLFMALRWTRWRGITVLVNHQKQGYSPRLRTNSILQGCVVKIEDFFRSKVKIHGILWRRSYNFPKNLQGVDQYSSWVGPPTRIFWKSSRVNTILFLKKI